MLTAIEVRMVLPLLQAVEAMVESFGVEDLQQTRIRVVALSKLAKALRTRIAR